MTSTNTVYQNDSESLALEECPTNGNGFTLSVDEGLKSVGDEVAGQVGQSVARKQISRAQEIA